MNDIFTTLSQGNLTPEQEEQLAKVLDARIEYTEAKTVLLKMRRDMLNGRVTKEQVNDYAHIVVAPLRLNLTTAVTPLVPDIINVEQIKSMLPMAVMALLNGINVKLLLELLELDSDQIDEMTAAIQQYIRG